MSALRGLICPKSNIKYLQVLTSPPFKQCHWFPAYKPGEAPTTKKEMEEAAKKYNMLPEEYQPDDEENALGDYPKLPLESVDARDPYYPWDYPELRRDYLQPVNRYERLVLPEMFTTKYPGYTTKDALTSLAVFLTCTSIICVIMCQFVLVRKITEPQYALPGLTHYSFELDYDKKKQ